MRLQLAKRLDLEEHDRNPDRGQDYDGETVQTSLPIVACEEGFEPPGGGLEMPRPFLTGSHMCFRLALAVLVILGLSGRLDATTANLLWQVVLP